MEKVEQVDREAAEHVLDTLLIATEPKMMSHDEAEDIIRQAFAAHRRTNDQAKDEEIARLQENIDLKADFIEETINDCAAQREQIARLREALEKIAKSDFNCAPRQYHIAMQGIAIKALGGSIA